MALSTSFHRRGQLRRAAVGFSGCSIPCSDRALDALRTWLDSWPGIGRIAVGMARQGYDLQLTRYDEKGWRATFYTTGMEHSPTSATGTGWERTPWHATQRAAVVKIRVGLNSGEVVVRAIGSDLHMDYTAVGQTTHLAARMEQLADPGAIVITPDVASNAPAQS
jgi:hypothetical protein